MHLDTTLTVTGTLFTATAGNVEAKPSRGETPQLCVGQMSKQFSDRIERTGVGCWVGRRTVAQRSLIDSNYFVDVLEPADASVGARCLGRTV